MACEVQDRTGWQDGTVKCEESFRLAPHAGHGLGQYSATSSHKARVHGPGWRTAHACSSIGMKGLIYSMCFF